MRTQLKVPCLQSIRHKISDRDQCYYTCNVIPRSNSSYLVESDYFAIFLHKFSRSALPSLEQTEHYSYWVCQMLVVVDLASALARMEGEAAYIQVAEVHHDLAAPPLVRLLVPSSCPAVHPSYPEAVDPLHPDQMD